MRSRLLQLLPRSSVALRSTIPAPTVYQSSLCLRLQKRFITADDKPLPEADKPGLGPNQEQLPHVSEEAAATGKIMGDEGPDIEQGTPVQEILKRDENSQIKPPRVIQEEIQKSSFENSKPFSSATRGLQEGLTQPERIESEGLKQSSGSGNESLAQSQKIESGDSEKSRSIENEDLKQSERVESEGLTRFEEIQSEPLNQSKSIENEGLEQYESVEDEGLIASEMSTAVSDPGHIFDVPTLPLPENDRLKHRYDPLILQMTNLMMRDGKKALAQRNMALILQYLRTTGPPKMNPNRPLLEGPSITFSLPLDPVRYLRLAIDSIAPLIRLRSYRGLAGGGTSLTVPVPLFERQRRRTAVMWILDAVSKRRSLGSGRTRFAHKVAEEIIAIVEGRSGLWERRGQLHKLGIVARSNIITKKK